MSRPAINETYMEIAHIMAKRSTCPRRSVGALLVKENRIISSGYNGAASKQQQCNEVGCLMEHGHCIRAIHAEHNVILFAARYGIETNNTTLYCTTIPCAYCAKAIIQAGITKVIYEDGDYSNSGADILKASNIELLHFGE